MEMTVYLLSALLTIAALALVFYPLYLQSRRNGWLTASREEQTLEEYEARYQALLASIRDLMFDYEMGKVAEDDYHHLLHQAKLQAAQVRQQMDRLIQGDTPALEAGLDADIEALVRQARQSRQVDPALARQVEAEIEALKQTPSTAAVCPHCGKPAQPGDRFCAYCGQSLPELPAGPTCPHCAAPVYPDDAFCARCGAALTAEIPLAGVNSE